MSPMSFNPDLSDVNETSFSSAVKSVGTTAVELFTGASRNSLRQVLIVYNDSLVTLFLGPSTVTTTGATKGTPLVPGQFASFPAGNVAIYAIAGTASNNCTVQELA